VVKTARIHPLRLWLLNSRKTQRWAAEALGVSKIYLSLVLSGARTPSRELLADMARLSKGGVTVKELVAFKKPSDRPRRLQPRPRRKGKPERTAGDAMVDRQSDPDAKPSIH
jgi:transcriptional regulator with XRE-family HTH domain